MESRVVKYVGIPGAILSSIFAIGVTGYVFGVGSGIEKGRSSRDLEVSELIDRTEKQRDTIRGLYSALENLENGTDDFSDIILTTNTPFGFPFGISSEQIDESESRYLGGDNITIEYDFDKGIQDVMEYP